MEQIKEDLEHIKKALEDEKISKEFADKVQGIKSDKIEDITDEIERDLIKNAKEEQEQEPIKKEILEDEEIADFTEDKNDNKSAFSTMLFIIGGFILVFVSIIGFFIFKSDDDVKETKQESAQESADNGLNGF